MNLSAALESCVTSIEAAPGRLQVTAGVDTGCFDIVPGRSVREILDATPLRVRAACAGTGTCGACTVRLVAGTVNPPTVAEYLKLDPDERAQGLRLACQLRPAGDATVALDHRAPPSAWMSIREGDLMPIAAAIADRVPASEGSAAPVCPKPAGTESAESKLLHAPYGIAVDLGTTHLRIALWHRGDRRRIATRRGPNPQAAHGADVLNRLAAARARSEDRLRLAADVRHALLDGLRDILARDFGEVGPMLAQIGAVFIVGNTAMLALLTGAGIDALVDPGNWTRSIHVGPADPTGWAEAWGLPEAQFVVAEPVAGFVGSDLVADVVATGLAGASNPVLLLDIGTNIEVALWDGERLSATSVSGGPAFEGSGVGNGMGAEAGAIRAVGGTPADWSLVTVGGAPPRGFCGSGLVDAVAVLRREGLVRPSGRFVTTPGPDGYRFVADNRRTGIRGSDIDLFQRAKASVAAAMGHLLAAAGLDWRDVARVCVCGAFGRMLDVANAQSVGLLPPVAAERIELHADASLAGCEIGLLAADGAQRFAATAARMRVTNLAHDPAYDDRFVASLRLEPIRPAAPSQA